MSSRSWVVVVVGMLLSIIAVQFDEPWLELAGTAGFVLLFAWVVVALRSRTGAARSELLTSDRPPGQSATTRDQPRPPQGS